MTAGRQPYLSGCLKVPDSLGPSLYLVRDRIYKAPLQVFKLCLTRDGRWMARLLTQELSCLE